MRGAEAGASPSWVPDGRRVAYISGAFPPDRMYRAEDIPRDARAPGVARRLLDGLAAGLEPDVVENARLLLSEVVTNSVRHGEGPTVRVVIDASDPGALRCEVVDEGGGFVPRAREGPSTAVGGWGLHLVETLSEAWGVREGSTHVWFELRAGSPGA
jgi:anti-sigma regulatory factor (Ser/Thr protein kinase)